MRGSEGRCEPCPHRALKGCHADPLLEFLLFGWQDFECFDGPRQTLLSWRARLLTCRVREPTMPNPTIKLIKQANQSWEIELRNPNDFDALVGRDVLNAFCRCFVHVDRLNSAVSCMYASKQAHGQDSVAYGRDLDAQVWFTVGTLRELAISIQKLRSALRKRCLLDPESDAWVSLRKLEKRWEDDEFYRTMRNVAAFHIDEQLIDKGLDELTMERRVLLANGQGRMYGNSRLTLGLLALQNGLGVDIDGYGDFLEVVVDDLEVAGPAIQKVFILTAQAVGVPFGDD